jgi:PAS domain S-box-containing protein
MASNQRLTPAEQLDAVGQAVITTDPAGVVVYWNPAAEQLYGWTAQEAVGSNIAELSVPEVAKEVAEEIMAALRDGVPWSGGFPVRRKDGSLFPALVTDAGIYRDGHLVGIVGVSTNLGSALRPLLERSTDAALLLRHDAVITYASPAVELLFGWEQDDLLGTSIVPLLHQEDRPALAALLEDVVARPGVHPPVEVRVQAWHDWRWAEAAFTNLLDDPAVRGVVCNLRPSPARMAQEVAELRARQLETALQSRLVIELAKGYLVGRDGVTPDEAFASLRSYARSHHLTVHDVCQRVVDGELLVEPPATT